ncbi:unnamed protein product, partial [Amoebophrya sp. A120]|eukprot:GSA120T00026209001.1
MNSEFQQFFKPPRMNMYLSKARSTNLAYGSEHQVGRCLLLVFRNVCYNHSYALQSMVRKKKTRRSQTALRRDGSSAC